jgi:hypothetical protein
MKRAVVASWVALGLLVPAWAMAAGPSKEECVAADDAAQDLRQAGRLRATRETLAICIAASCPGPVREDCTQRIEEVTKAQPTIVFEVKDAAGNDVSAIRVTVDGQPLAKKLDGTPLLVDPGEHHFAFDDADGIAHTEKTIVVHEGEKDRRERIVLGGASATSSPSPGPSPSETGSTSDGSSQRTIGLVVGGGGALAFVVGGVFGFVAKSTYNGATGCPNACTADGYSQGQSAYHQATIATVGLAAGAALIAGGAVLYFTAPKAGGLAVSASVGTNSAGLRFGGSW